MKTNKTIHIKNVQTFHVGLYNKFRWMLSTQDNQGHFIHQAVFYGGWMVIESCMYIHA